MGNMFSLPKNEEMPGVEDAILLVAIMVFVQGNYVTQVGV